MSIVLTTRELLEDSQFPIIDKDLLEAMKYASLWAAKDANRIRDGKIFLVFMEMNLRMGINCNPWFFPTTYNSLQSFAVFKADNHSIYIRAHKDLAKQWRKLPFVATDDFIFNILETWPLEWHTPSTTEIENSIAHRKKEEAKFRITQLEEKRRNKVVEAELRVAQDVAQTTTEQEKVATAAVVQEETVKVHKGQMSPSHGHEAKEEEEGINTNRINTVEALTPN